MTSPSESRAKARVSKGIYFYDGRQLSVDSGKDPLRKPVCSTEWVQRRGGWGDSVGHRLLIRYRPMFPDRGNESSPGETFLLGDLVDVRLEVKS